MAEGPWDFWASDAWAFSRAFRGLADRLDRALTEQRPDDVRRVESELADLAWEMEAAVIEMPPTSADAAGTLADAAEIQMEDR